MKIFKLIIIICLLVSCGSIQFPLHAENLITFDNDQAYLSSKHYLNSNYYEVNRIIHIDDTDENLIIAPSAFEFDAGKNVILIGDYLSGKIRIFSLKNFKYNGDLIKENNYGKKIIGNPSGILIDKKNSKYVITDLFFNKVFFFDRAGFLENTIGSLGEALAEFSEPHSIASDGEDIYISDRYNCRICVYSQNGAFKYSFASRGDGINNLYMPGALLINESSEVFVCDSGNDRIQIFDKHGVYLRTIGRRGRQPGEFNAPADIAFDSNHNLYVSDSLNRRIQKFDISGNFICEISQLTSSFLSDNYKPDFYYKIPRNYDSNEINFSLGNLKLPTRIDVNLETAHLYVMDAESKNIYIFDCDNFNKGRKLYLGKNFRDAITYFEKVLKQEPDNQNALYYLAYCHQQINDYAKAYQYYAQIINSNTKTAVEKFARYHQKILTATMPKDSFAEIKLDEKEVKNAELQIYKTLYLGSDKTSEFEQKRYDFLKQHNLETLELDFQKQLIENDDEEQTEKTVNRQDTQKGDNKK